MNPVPIIYGCVAVALLSGAFWLGGLREAAQFADYRTKVMASTAKAAELARRAEITARLVERSHTWAMNEIAKQHEQDRADADAAADRTIAGLRAGTDKLRAQWQGCKATDELSRAVAGAAGPIGQDRLREEDLRNVRRWAELLQAQRDGLQAVTEADRK